jgi:hypothetical protein
MQRTLEPIVMLLKQVCGTNVRFDVARPLKLAVLARPRGRRARDQVVVQVGIVTSRYVIDFSRALGAKERYPQRFGRHCVIGSYERGHYVGKV